MKVQKNLQGIIAGLAILCMSAAVGCNPGKNPRSDVSSQTSGSAAHSTADQTEGTTDATEGTGGEMSGTEITTGTTRRPLTNPMKPTGSGTPAPLSGATGLYGKSVKDYGAKGDGKTDDTAAIQKALNETTNHIVFFPKGEYKVTKTLLMPTGTTLIGEPADGGTGGSVIKAAAGMDSLISTRHSNAFNVTFESLTLDGGRSNGHKVGRLLDLYNIMGARVANVNMVNVSGDGIYTENLLKADQNEMEAPPQWVQFIENVAYSGSDGYALYFVASDSFINGFHVNGGKGIKDYLFGGNCYTNLRVENVKGSGLTLGSGAGDVGDNAITNSVFRNNSEYGILIPGGADSVQNKIIAVDSCDFSGNKKADIGLKNAGYVSIIDNNLRSEKGIDAVGKVDFIAVNGNAFAAASCMGLGAGSKIEENSFAGRSWKQAGINRLITEAEYRDIYKAAAGALTGGRKFVNVRTYGAKGDGETNDARAIQTAVDALPAAGGTVYFPSGTYAVGTAILLRDNITLLGDGSSGDATVISFAGNTKHMITTNKATSGVKVLNMNLANENFAANANTILNLTQLKNSIFSNIRVRGNNVDNAIVIGEQSSGLKFSACLLEADQYESPIMVLRGKNCVVQSSYLSHGKYGIYMEGGGGHTILGVHLDWHNAAIVYKNKTAAPLNVTVKGCYFDVSKLCHFFDFDKAYEANVTVRSCVYRVNAYDLEGPEGKQGPEIVIQNGRKINLLGNSFDMGYSLRVFQSDALTIKANSAFALYAHKNPGKPGGASAVSGNAVKMVD